MALRSSPRWAGGTSSAGRRREWGGCGTLGDGRQSGTGPSTPGRERVTSSTGSRRRRDFLKAYGVKGFACVNVLVFENELDRVADCLRELERAGVDAVIVQDFGVMRLAREVAPGLKVHASTQSSVCSAPGARHARSLGAERVVLGRERSLGEIARVSRELDDAPELEVFVHGALASTAASASRRRPGEGDPPTEACAQPAGWSTA